MSQYELLILIPSTLGMICILLITYMLYNYNEATQKNNLIGKYADLRGDIYRELKESQNEDKLVRERQYEDYVIAKSKISYLETSLEHNKIELNLIKSSMSETARDNYRIMSILSLGLNVDDIKIQRYIPVRIYMSDSNKSSETAISNAVEELLSELGFEVVDDIPGIKGSWFKEWFAKSYRKMTQQEVTDRLKQIEEAAILKGIDLPQAEIDQKRANSAAEIIKAAPESSDVIAMLGSTLVLKIVQNGKATVFVKTLTKFELTKIENDPTILSSPAEILERISEKPEKPDANLVGYKGQNLLNWQNLNE